MFIEKRRLREGRKRAQARKWPGSKFYMLAKGFIWSEFGPQERERVAGSGVW